MTTTNVFSGVQDKTTSRVLKAPGGGSSGIFGHYQEEEANGRQQQREVDAQKVQQSLQQAALAQAAGDQAQDNFARDKEIFTANRNRNYGTGAPFATSDSLVQSPPPVKTAQQQCVIGDDYQTPQQRQAQNPNKGQNTFNNLFGDDEGDGAANGKSKGKISTHNPVTWQAYSNYDSNQDQPAHKSRYESHAAAKSGTYNPITGKEHENEQPITRVKAPPGGVSTIQF